MPISLQWADDAQQEVLLIHFTEPWRWQEFEQVALEALALIQARPQRPVDVILNLLDCVPFHRINGLTRVWTLVRGWRLTQPSYFVLVSVDPSVRVMARVLRQGQPHLRDYLLMVDTEADAFAMLAHHRR